MTFLTNNAKWAAGTICELYKARWEIEVFFKELKQTLQLADFIGTNEYTEVTLFTNFTPFRSLGFEDAARTGRNTEKTHPRHGRHSPP